MAALDERNQFICTLYSCTLQYSMYHKTTTACMHADLRVPNVPNLSTKRHACLRACQSVCICMQMTKDTVTPHAGRHHLLDAVLLGSVAEALLHRVASSRHDDALNTLTPAILSFWGSGGVWRFLGE